MRKEFREALRSDLHTEIEFFVDADVIQATSVNVSKTGIRFDTDNQIMVRLRVDPHGEKVDYEARLVWVKEKDGGGMSIGLEFVEMPED
ncbi:MAG: PilZ domain-containing protein [Planctomycetes bacterium]|nr:PilZ domain-containing protein [Planctomycetota bacterium]